MKKLSFLIFGIGVLVMIGGCIKNPTAIFTTDKDTYTAGDIVHLKDASTNAYSCKWTMPDGTVFTTQNVDYPLDSSSLGTSKTFSLQVADKDGDETNTYSKTIRVSSILPRDYFAIDTIIYNPITLYSNASNSIWCIGGGIGDAGFGIYLPGTTAPTASGIYTLQQQGPLSAGQAIIQIFEGPVDATAYYNSLSGQLYITVTSDGRIRAVFNNIPVYKLNFGNGYGTISGDITFH